MNKIIEVIEPGCKAKTASNGIEGFITAAKIGKGGVVYYEFSYFVNDGYRQTYLEEFEFIIENENRIKIGFKN